MNDMTLWHRPSLDDSRQGDRTRGGEVEIVSGTHGKVAEELEIADVVGAELEIADGETVGGCAFEGTEVEGLDGAGVAESVVMFL